MKPVVNRIEKIVLVELIELGKIPSRDEVLQRASVSVAELEEVDSQYHVLESLWRFKEPQRKVFFSKLQAETKKPESLESLFYLIAQTELQIAKENLKKQT
jgi:hypothetical protein